MILLLINSNVNAQSQKVLPVSPTIPTPNAASIGIYGEVPVSYFTGIPEINVPLYTIAASDLSVPISLNYYSGGFRPDVHPSWVGLNWTLNAGGAITRVVKGYPDENNDAYPNAINMSCRGYYYSHDLLANSNWASESYNHSIYQGDYIDREPDVFSFNFLDFSGKFFLDHNGNWKVQSNKALKVSFDPQDFKTSMMYTRASSTLDVTKTFNKFTLTDGKGVQYIFGTDNAIEYTIGMKPTEYDYAFGSIATSWYLVKIVPPLQGGDIDFEYERGPFQSSFNFFQSRRFCASPPANSGFLSVPFWGGSSSYGLAGSMTSPVYLTAVSYPRGNVKVHFNTSKSQELKYPAAIYLDVLKDENGMLPGNFPNQYLAFDMVNAIPYFQRNPQEALPDPSDYSAKFIWLKLDTITVEPYASVYTGSSTSAFVKKIGFCYTEHSTKRLQLDSVVSFSDGDINRQCHSFKYNPYQQLPDYVTQLTDHWGFYNDYELENSFGRYLFKPIPEDQIFTRRQPSSKSVSGLIQEITYPTGGKTKFEFESNDYWLYIPENRQQVSNADPFTKAGGARIKKIQIEDGTGNTSMKEYFYLSDLNPVTLTGTRSSGILSSYPKYLFGLTATTVQGQPFVYSLNSSSSVVPLSSTSGGRFIGYTTVAEKRQDGAVKVYSFSSDLTNSDDVPINVYNQSLMGKPLPYSSKEIERGKLLSESGYKPGGLLSYKTDYIYQKVNYTEDNLVRTVNIDNSIMCSGSTNNNANSVVSLSAGYEYAYYYLPTQINRYTYDNLGGALLTQEFSEYDKYANLLKSTTYGSNGKKLEQRYTFSHHYPGTAIADIMSQKNMVSLPFTIDKYVSDVLVSGVKNTYAQFSTAQIIRLSEIYTKSFNNPYDLEITYTQYDAYGHLLEAVKKSGETESYIWGYGYKWPVASIKNATYTAAAAAINQSIVQYPYDKSDELSELNKLRTALPQAFVNTFAYGNNGELLETNDFNNLSKKYDYNTAVQLTSIKDKNGNIVANYDYRYKDLVAYPFSNDLSSGNFQKNDCPINYAGTIHTYTVPAGKYGSYISKADANNKAALEISQLGQLEANRIGNCSAAYQVTYCCNWGSVYTNFIYNESNHSVNFSLKLYKTGDNVAYGQIATLTGALFVPSSAKYVSVNTASGTYTLNFASDGTITITGSDLNGILELNGSYQL